MAVADEMINHTVCVTCNQVLKVVAELDACYSRLMFFNHMDQVLACFNFIG